MQSIETIGIDLPLKILVWQDEAGSTWVSYNDPVGSRRATGSAMMFGLRSGVRRHLRVQPVGRPSGTDVGQIFAIDKEKGAFEGPGFP
jgi:hypothetical protein